MRGEDLRGVLEQILKIATEGRVRNEGGYSLLFEGVQGLTREVVNGTDIGGSVNGYTEFEVDLGSVLVPGENVVDVRVDNTDQPNSRWYTGSGIYRPVWLIERGEASFARDGLRFVTSLRNGAVTLQLNFQTVGDVPSDAEVRLSLWDGARQVADTTGAARDGRLSVLVGDALLWTAENPHLYRAVVQLVTADGVAMDENVVPIGLRTIRVEAGRGLLINGEPTLLRGACIHHDSGILGAATFRAAEFRRAHILKANGFNAVRSSHNPLSRDMLDACDELGLYVMDELTDLWTGTSATISLAGERVSIGRGVHTRRYPITALVLPDPAAQTKNRSQ